MLQSESPVHSTAPDDSSHAGVPRWTIRGQSWIGSALLTVALVVVPATAARAENLPNLPQSAGALELNFSPAYDYDGDGCYAVAAISPDGTLNGGLNTSGAVNGNCRDRSDLDRTQTYARSKCNNGWCAIVYASYFEKDQTVQGCCGHRHDWEHVISWVSQSSNQVEYVTRTVHSDVQTYPRSSVRFDGTHPKMVYHKEGAFGSHNFRLANSNDEPPENHYGDWRYPPIVDWNGWPSSWLRDRLMTANFSAATIKITDQDDRFRNLLSRSKPASIPFDPWA
ncbi:NPP1 family protein [Micromonospora sp. NBC_01813]|uniref:NPP1 family protein n=1 Tax=Micromonospora sp. NBC_01813 TaxID=2975988 RepID=UPI002DD934CE|nr:NPP1 family protein [Micromonospora sp. NBC_01813]WSA12177.1 NPP1 family protein [Micromonospora sp. NBC_01813]